MAADADRFASSFSVAAATGPLGGFRDLGITPLAAQLGLTPEQTNGHWCSRCEGIWFGYTLEAQCPVCGNRKG
ncbi:MAG: hypothetical protein V4792_05635 [Pseudomonadota bacterium]